MVKRKSTFMLYPNKKPCFLIYSMVWRIYHCTVNLINSRENCLSYLPPTVWHVDFTTIPFIFTFAKHQKESSQDDAYEPGTAHHKLAKFGALNKNNNNNDTKMPHRPFHVIAWKGQVFKNWCTVLAFILRYYTHYYYYYNYYSWIFIMFSLVLLFNSNADQTSGIFDLRHLFVQRQNAALKLFLIFYWFMIVENLFLE